MDVKILLGVIAVILILWWRSPDRGGLGVIWVPIVYSGIAVAIWGLWKIVWEWVL